MKKKFKIIDASSGEKIKLKEGEMMSHKWVMNDQGEAGYSPHLGRKFYGL